eukprot:364499-Chlamydomonas_euryale.AAC.1
MTLLSHPSVFPIFYPFWNNTILKKSNRLFHLVLPYLVGHQTGACSEALPHPLHRVRLWSASGATKGATRSFSIMCQSMRHSCVTGWTDGWVGGWVGGCKGGWEAVDPGAGLVDGALCNGGDSAAENSEVIASGKASIKGEGLHLPAHADAGVVGGGQLSEGAAAGGDSCRHRVGQCRRSGMQRELRRAGRRVCMCAGKWRLF